MYYESRELLLRAESVSQSFGKNSVLKDVSFEIHNIVEPGGSIPRGQVVALLGPSGVGKTQLFRCIAGLQIPTSGAIFINNHTEPVKAGEVGVVAQDYPLIETRTVMDNLHRAFRIAERRQKAKKASDKEVDDFAKSYLERFGIEGVAKHYPSQLSGGQRQRAAIVQQMMCSKHFLLMDEPFSGLDVIAKEAAASLIADMASQDELNTVILTTHDIEMACAVADRVILLGRDKDEAGNKIPGARIKYEYDLKKEDLCWIPGITLTPKFLMFVADMKRQFHDL